MRDPLLVVCRYFAGEQLVALVKLLCENGANVNAMFERHSWDMRSNETTTAILDAIGVLLHLNKSQVHLSDRLIEIMKPYTATLADESQRSHTLHFTTDFDIHLPPKFSQNLKQEDRGDLSEIVS